MQNSETNSTPKGMYTSCPDCLKQFRIQASQLSIAAGQVKCGECGHEFNALSRLSDIPLTLDQINFDYEPKYKSAPAQEPEFEIPETVHVNEVLAEEVSEGVGADEGGAHSESPEGIPGEIPYELPDELREEFPVKRSLFATISWAFGAFSLLLVIIAQLAWFNRDELLLRYPQVEPFAREICERLHCEILRHRDISSIKLLNRDVRNHPLYEGKLLVNATMANRSDTIQPYPQIQLALFNPGGEVIGYREFKPEEYLDDSINIQAGMLPESPIHFVLEVSGPTKDAVSFEFHFL
jgi:predicted Zn finger-like uncharacterized protein